RSGAGTRVSGGEACGPAAAGAQAQERACRVSPVGERAGMLCAAWPYPLWIAHRGAGRLAPENTLAAFALGHGFGYRMFECDARLSADGEVFLLHDDRLERTTDGSSDAVVQPWSALAGLDAGAWHGEAFVGERLPTLADVIDFCAA